MVKSLRLVTFFAVLFIAAFYFLQPIEKNISLLSDSETSTGFVEHKLSSLLHQPVHVGDVSWHWKGSKPILQINQLQVLTGEGLPALSINQVQLGIDLVGSFLLGKVVLGDVSIDGANLVVNELGGGIVDINHVNFLRVNLNDAQSKKLDMLLEAFLSSGVKQIHNTNLLWYDQHGKLILPLNKIQLTADSNFLARYFEGSAQTWHDTPLQLSGSLYGNYYAKHFLFSKTKFVLGKIRVKDNPIFNRFLPTLQFNNGQLHLDGTLKLKPHKISLKAHLVGDNLSVWSKYSHNEIEKVRAKLKLAYSQNLCQMSVRNLNLVSNHEVLPIHAFTFKQYQTQTQTIRSFHLDNFPIAKIVSFLAVNQLLSPKLDHALKQVAPSGNIKNFALDLMQLPGESYQQVALNGNLQSVSFAPWEGLPGFKNLSGQVNFTPHAGTFVLNTHQTTLILPRVFRQNLLLLTANGKISWQYWTKDRWQVSVKRFALTSDEGDVSGQMKVRKVGPQAAVDIQSRANFSLYNLSGGPKFYPVNIMPSALVAWLDKGVKGGAIHNGKFILNGRMSDFPFNKKPGSFSISGDLTKGRLHFLDGWPEAEEIEAHLIFDRNSMSVSDCSGKLLGARVSGLEVKLPAMEKAVLSLAGQIKHAGNSKLTLVGNNNPIAKYIHSKLLNELQIQGPWQLALRLLLPLDKSLTSKPVFEGNLQLKNVDIGSLNSPFALKNLKGNLAFSQNSIQSTPITGNLLSQPFRLNFDTVRDALGHNQTTMKMVGTLAVSDLKNLYSAKILNQLQGQTPFEGMMQLTPGNEEINLTVKTSLKGISSNLPAPMDKAAEHTQPSEVQIKHTAAATDINFKYGHVLQGALIFDLEKDHWHFARGTVQFNEAYRMPIPISPGLLITGQLSELDWNLWKETLFDSKASKEIKIGAILPLVNKVDVKIGRLGSSNSAFSDLKLEAISRDNSLLVGLNGKTIKGSISLAGNYPHVPIKANLNYLEIHGSSEANRLTPKDIPSLDLAVADFHYKDKNFKNVGLKVRPTKNEVVIEQAVVNSPMTKLSATGVWREVGQRQQTLLNGSFSSNNLGAVLNQWHITDNVVQGHGSATFNVSWKNSPLNPETKTLNGSIDLHFNEGRIIKLSNGANFGMGVGRILNLFSLQTFPRRLRGDFSDLTESGFSFDMMNGQLQFKEGSAFTEGTTLEGTVGKVKVNGRIGFASKDYNLRLTIYPNVTSSLPVVATLTAGPIVGALTWVADKLLSHQVKKMTEIHYTVTGSWDKPSLTTLSMHPQQTDNKHE